MVMIVLTVIMLQGVNQFKNYDNSTVNTDMLNYMYYTVLLGQ